MSGWPPRFSSDPAPGEHAALVAAHLVEANLAGHDSHGVLRVPQYVELIDAGRLKPEQKMQVVQRSAASAVVDGRGGFGQVIADGAMRLAIELARTGGIGAVTVRNCSHTGRIGTYTQMAVREGLVGIGMVNTGGGANRSRLSVEPAGGCRPIRSRLPRPRADRIRFCSTWPLASPPRAKCGLDTRPARVCRRVG